jgi:L-asparagine oxygenase
MIGDDRLTVGDLAEVTIELTADEAEHVRKLGTELLSGYAPGSLDDPGLLSEVEMFGRALPAGVAATLSEFRRSGNDFGTLVVRGIPLDEDLPPTPAAGDADDWRRVGLATVVQLAIVSFLGDVIAYADEKAGRLVQDIIPVRGAEARQENSGSVLLELHTEDGFHPYKPDYLTLLCIRPDQEGVARTVTGAIRRAMALLPAACVEVLRKPLFRIKHASSFLGSAGGSTDPLAVLSGPLFDPELVTDFHAMEPLDHTAEWALTCLRDAMTTVLAGTVMQAGDLLVVDNRSAVHGRTAFEPRYDGHDRWLRRCFAVADLRRSRAARVAGSHVCAPLWAL